MRRILQLSVCLLLAIHFTAAAAPAGVSQFVGTWRIARDAGTVVHVRITADGRVDFVSPRDGSSVRGQALAGNVQGGFTGMLPDGGVFAVGTVRGFRTISLGAQWYALEALLPEHSGNAAHEPAKGAPPTFGGGTAARSSFSLAGVRLSTAKGRNGYFTERSYEFCSDGRVFMRFAELQSSQFGNGASERLDQGTWRQDGATLRLNLARAGAASFALQRVEARVVRLDATSYAAEPARRCR